ncbi:hypothetical protein [Streptomyces sp. NPDC050504]|uniref:hypothetical protein n=1 Tax=Streptomyces sp. NPDC050504 TaxID=3365618 RepID=UPI003789B73E
MHPYTHLRLHEARAAELRADAGPHPLSPTLTSAPTPANTRGHRPDLRARLGWTMVELGLRLVRDQQPSGLRTV